MTAPGVEDPSARLDSQSLGVNMAELLPRGAAAHPERTALIEQGPKDKDSWRRINYADLEAKANRIASGLHQRGVGKGTRVCLFVRPSIELIAITYALFKLGAVPVLADPGMGRKRLLDVIRRMQPRVFIGIPIAHAIRLAFRSAFSSVELAVTVGRRVCWGGPTLQQLEEGAGEPLPAMEIRAEDIAAILFTSGSTGPPKGVVYTHAMFQAQIRALDALYAFEAGEVDLACFPLFALFDVAFGMTTVIPDLDASRPGSCKPERVVRALLESGATTSFGSPAIWRRVVPYCIEAGIQLPSLKRVLIAGAPVPRALIADFHKILPPDGDVHTPYGATEALPVTSISGREVCELAQRTRSGGGTCVGKAAADIDLCLIRVDDAAHAEWRDDRVVGAGELGEVCVRGPVVTEVYAEDAKATAGAKMKASPGQAGLWHRMGDVASLDSQGRLWIAGRKAHRLQTESGMRFPVPTENAFNEHPRVLRSALVGVGQTGAERPVLVIQFEAGQAPATQAAEALFFEELDQLAAQMPAELRVEQYLIHSAFPVDVRHNAKIHREELKLWAEGQLGTKARASGGQLGRAAAGKSQ